MKRRLAKFIAILLTLSFFCGMAGNRVLAQDETPMGGAEEPQSGTVEFIRGDIECCDPMNGKYVFNVTYRILEGAEGDQVIDLTWVLNAAEGYGVLKGVQPGDTFEYNIQLVNNSGHTYRYKAGSFSLTTPDWDEPLSGEKIIAFDGKSVPERYQNAAISLGLYIRDASVAQLLYEAKVITSNDNTINNSELNAMVSGRGRARGLTSDEWTLIDNFLRTKYQENSGTTVDKIYKFVTDYYNDRYNTSYADISELVQYNREFWSMLYASDNNTTLKICRDNISEAAKFGLDASGLVKVAVPCGSYSYDNFYQSILSIFYGDEEEYQEFTSNLLDSCSWKTCGREAAIGDYMKSEHSTTGTWTKADTYFTNLLNNGLTSDEATWKKFCLAINFDGIAGGNEYQLTKWSWSNSLVLEQIDGDFELTKTDENGAVITSDETEFELWYETSEQGVSKKYYCTYIPSTAEGAQGTYGFVECDPNSNDVKYTVRTTNGVLTIDNTLLEGMTYYVREAVAPKDYELDKTVYVLCGQNDYNGACAALGSDKTEFDGSINRNTKLQLSVSDKKIKAEEPVDPPYNPPYNPPYIPPYIPPYVPEDKPTDVPTNVPTNVPTKEVDIPGSETPGSFPTAGPDKPTDAPKPSEAPKPEPTAKPTKAPEGIEIDEPAVVEPTEEIDIAEDEVPEGDVAEEEDLPKTFAFPMPMFYAIGSYCAAAGLLLISFSRKKK